MPIAQRKSAPAATEYLSPDVDESDEAPVDEDVFSPDDEDAVAARTSALPSGWKAALDASKDAGGAFTNEFKFTGEAQLVKFLGSEPFAVYSQHWIERQGKRSFICSKEEPGGCPLCDKGDVPRPKTAFSVLNLSAEDPIVEMLIASPTLLTQMAGLDQDPKTGPLDRLYWAVSKTGTKKTTAYTMQAVKARDLEDDWGCDQAEVEAVVEQFEPLTGDAIYRTPRAELVAIARELNR